jgi:hypothetical protein
VFLANAPLVIRPKEVEELDSCIKPGVVGVPTVCFGGRGDPIDVLIRNSAILVCEPAMYGAVVPGILLTDLWF